MKNTLERELKVFETANIEAVVPPSWRPESAEAPLKIG
jgi:hypothetical protein